MLGLGTVAWRKVNDDQNKKTAEPNKYPPVCASDPLNPLSSNETDSVMVLALLSGGLGLSPTQAKTTIPPLNLRGRW